MSIKLKALSHFEKRLKRLIKKHGSLIEDLTILSSTLKTNPQQGQFLGAGLYKIRLSTKSKGGGKSGGFRVITYFVDQSSEDEIVYLVTIYDKSEYANIAKKELLKIIMEELG